MKWKSKRKLQYLPLKKNGKEKKYSFLMHKFEMENIVLIFTMQIVTKAKNKRGKLKLANKKKIK